MKKEYILQGLNCAQCAAAIEESVKKIEGASRVSLNFATSTIRFDIDANQSQSIKATIEKIVHDHEPEVHVVERAIKKEYILQGLNCAQCATAIEESIRKIDGISQASLNFTTSVLRLIISASLTQNINTIVESIVHEHEADVKVIERTPQAKTTTSSNKGKILRLVIGVLALAIGILMENLTSINPVVPTIIFLLTYLLLGITIVYRAVRNIFKGRFFDENTLMAIATIGAIAIGQHAEAVGVVLFYQIGLFFQNSAVRKSKESIANLMNIRPDYANLQKDGEVKKVASESIEVGDIIVVKPGERIPLDGVIVSGQSTIDVSALTGESVPISVGYSETVLSGSVNQHGLLTVKVSHSFSESTASKIIELVENAAENKSPTESFITKFAKYYTPAVVALAILIATIPPLFFAAEWADWIRRGLIFLVISCPCALVISIPLGFFGGIGRASRKGILVKGGNYLEALNKLDHVVFDKTGTLTKGVFRVTEVLPATGISRNDLLKAAAQAEIYSNHPIAVSILREYNLTVDKSSLSDYQELPGLGTKVTTNGKTIIAGNDKLMKLNNVVFSETSLIGTKVYLSVDGQYLGCIVIADEIKPDGYHTVSALKSLGVKRVTMLTGDSDEVAKEVAQKLQIDDVHSNLLPQDKVEKLKELLSHKQRGGKLAFMGDGINDAPVLALADIGIAMGGLGSDAAIEAADVVLMTDEPYKLVEAIHVSRLTKSIVTQNIAFAFGIKALFLVLGALGVASMWEAVFADVGVAVLAILNSTRILRF